MAIPMPMEKRDKSAISNVGRIAKRSAAAEASTNPMIRTVFSEYFSIKTPEGMDITPYATKKENGKKPASPMLRSKLSIISGTSGPRILVRKEITEKIKNIRRTINVFFFIKYFCERGFWQHNPFSQNNL